MSYVQSNLMSGECVVYAAKVHWFIFIPGLIWLAIGISFFSKVTLDSGPTLLVWGLVAIFFAITTLTRAILAKISTELAVTSNRVIAKKGLIARSTIELNHAKVESFNVDQSVFGRLFGFGTITVNGTGGVRTPFRCIESPLDFRRKAVETIDATQSRASR